MKLLSNGTVLSAALLTVSGLVACTGGTTTDGGTDVATSDARDAVSDVSADVVGQDTATMDVATDTSSTDVPSTDTPATDTPSTDTPAPDVVMMDDVTDVPVPTDVPVAMDVTPIVDVPVVMDVPPPDAGTVPGRRLLHINTTFGTGTVYSVDDDGIIHSTASISTSFGSLVGQIYGITPTGTGRDAYVVINHPTTNAARVFRVAGDREATTTALPATTLVYGGPIVGVRPSMILNYSSTTGTLASYTVNDTGTFTPRDARGGLTISTGSGYRFETNRNGEVVLIHSDDGAGYVIDVSSTGSIAFRRTLAAGTFPTGITATSWAGGSTYTLYNGTTRTATVVTIAAAGTVTTAGTTGDIGNYRALEGFSDGVTALYHDFQTRTRVGTFSTSSPYFSPLGGERMDLPTDNVPAIFALP